VRTVSAVDGLRGRTTVILYLDRSGYLWAGTEKGINRLDVATYRQTGAMPVRSYGKAEGFLGVEAAWHATHETAAGALWFGTGRGVTRYDPQRDQAQTEPPRTYITDLRFFSEDPDWRQFTDRFSAWEQLPLGLSLPHEKNHLIFHFTGLHFSAPGQVAYQYKLDGFDTQWSRATDQRRATYSNIPPGTYVFRVKAATPHGAWSPAAAYTFTITPPFWQTEWFYGLCALGLVTLVMGIIRWRTWDLEQRKRILGSAWTTAHRPSEPPTPIWKRLTRNSSRRARMRSPPPAPRATSWPT
jgi:hypothetical protein